MTTVTITVLRHHRRRRHYVSLFSLSSQRKKNTHRDKELSN